ncbi:MAG: hypothetical protein ACJAZT_001622 [Gammaproteobacteria bacterium]
MFIVDVDANQDDILDKVAKAHPELKLAGTGKASPRWLVMGQYKIKKIMSEIFP